MTQISNRLAWHYFTFDLPSDWEITRYSILDDNGRLDFNNRDGYLARIAWQKCKKPPDEKAIMEEFHHRHLREHDREAAVGFDKIKTLKVGKFLFGYRNRKEPCQAAIYLEKEKVLLVWTFPNYKSTDLKGVWTPIVESFAPNVGDIREWSAFGLHLYLPKEFELSDCHCLPADITMTFKHNKKYQQVIAQRWGLPDELLREQTLTQFYRRGIHKAGGRIKEAKDTTFRGMPAVELTYHDRGERGFDRLMGSRWQGAGTAWLNEEEKRIYGFKQLGPRKAKYLDIKEVLA
jgi:hypothetical protein